MYSGNYSRVAAANGARELLGTVVLVEEVVGDFLEVGKVRAEKGGAETTKVRVCWVVDLDDSPWVATAADGLAVDHNLLLGTNNGEWKQGAELTVVCDCLIIVLLGVVREVVHWDGVVLDVLHNALLESFELLRGEGVGLANDRNDVDAW